MPLGTADACRRHDSLSPYTVDSLMDGDNTLIVQALILAACGIGTVFALLSMLVGCISLLPHLTALLEAATPNHGATTAAPPNNTLRRAVLAAARHHHRRQQATRPSDE